MEEAEEEVEGSVESSEEELSEEVSKKSSEEESKYPRGSKGRAVGSTFEGRGSARKPAEKARVRSNLKRDSNDETSSELTFGDCCSFGSS